MTTEPVDSAVLEVAQIFMPEGKCARCAERVSNYDVIFVTKSTGGTKQNVKLGFCSTYCENLFVGGVEASKEMRL